MTVANEAARSVFFLPLQLFRVWCDNSTKRLWLRTRTQNIILETLKKPIFSSRIVMLTYS